MPYGDVDADATGGFAGGGASGPGGPGGAGGLGTGTAEAVGSLADALADALGDVGTGVDTFGSIAAQDAEARQGGQLSPGEEQRNEAAIEAEAQAAAQSAYDDIMGTSSGLADASVAALGGFAPEQTAAGTPGFSQSAADYGTGVEDFSSGGYATAPATSDLSFGAYGQQTQPSGDVLSPGEQQRVDAQVLEDYQPQEWGGPVQQSFAGPQMTAPGQSTSPYSSDTAWKTSAQASPYGAMSELGLTGHRFAQGNPIGYAGPNSQFMSTSQNVEDQVGGEWKGAAAVDTFTNMPMAQAFTSPTQPEGALSASQPGMISAGTTGPGPTEGTINEWSGLDVPGTTLPGSTTAAYDAGTPTGATAAGGALEDQNIENKINSKVADITAKVNTPETNTAAHKQVAQSRLDMQTTLDEKAKADPNGRVKDKFGNKTTVTNQQLANAYRGFDTTLAAYATINGQNSLVSMIANNLPGVNMASKMLGGISGFLVNRGIFNKTSAEDIVQMIQDNLAAGEQPGAGSQWGGGEGGMEAEMAVQQQVSSFIQQYPWAAELDPKYIKYLIDNPAELQDLLGQEKLSGEWIID
jgi:hypothetical protein